MPQEMPEADRSDRVAPRAGATVADAQAATERALRGRPCSVSTCRRHAVVLIRFTGMQSLWPFCHVHDARADGPRRLRRGWQPWQVAEAIDL